MKDSVEYWKAVNPIKVNGEPIKFTDTAEHVGVVRSVAGNLPSILSRISAHKNALGAVLHTGLARSHRGNPAASLRIQQIRVRPIIGYTNITDTDTDNRYRYRYDLII